MKEQSIYFKNLNALRFFAALVVLLSHVGQLTNILGYNAFFSSQFTPLITGETGVLLFFALSGFLITYLLLAEENVTGTISVKKFYIRRALRIWPLYFFTVALALFAYPFIEVLQFKGYSVNEIWLKLPLKILFYCLFMPAVVMDFLGFIPYATHTWTIGAEEQFYFIWPVLFKNFKNKIAVIIAVIIIYTVVYYALYFLPDKGKITAAFFLLWKRYPVNCMAIGGIYAYIIFAKNHVNISIQKILFSLWSQVLVYGLLMYFIITKAYFKYFNSEIYTILLGFLVCNMAANAKTIFNIENRLFNYLGKISFGLYMFHPVAIVCAIKTCVFFNLQQAVYLYIAAVIFTTLPAAASYHFFEIFFINKKGRHTLVASGNKAA